MPRMNSVMIACVLLLAAVMLGEPSADDKVRPAIDHSALYVRDLPKSADFYEKVMRLERMPDPFKDDRHVWFRLGPTQQLHVIGGATTPRENEINVHLAFRVADLAAFMQHLDQMHVDYRGLRTAGKAPNVRTDGVKQIYFQDPDGYWIEVNDAHY